MVPYASNFKIEDEEVTIRNSKSSAAVLRPAWAISDPFSKKALRLGIWLKG